jgi:hypothetical protein
MESPKDAFGRRTEKVVSRDGGTVTVELARGDVDVCPHQPSRQLDEILQCIRAGRNIRTRIITCRKCGMTGPAAPPHVSVRALILALSRFEIASRDKTRVLEKDWDTVRIVDSQTREKP